MNENKPASVSRILLVDDHPVLRQGLVRLIENEKDMEVCGEAETAEEAMAAIASSHPTLAIVDLSLGGRPGLELVKDLRDRYPDVRVLVLSMHDEMLWAERTLRAGACGYVMKQEKPRALMAKIRQALRGEVCISDAVNQSIVRKLAPGGPSKPAQAEDGLGDRELEVLQLIGHGLSTRDIAAAMHISIKTVESHREHLKKKLNLANGDDLLRYAVHRFLESSEPRR